MMRIDFLIFLILFSKNVFSQSDIVDTNCYYINTITSEDSIYIETSNSEDSLVKNGYFYIIFLDEKNFFKSELYVGSFNSGIVCCELDSGYFGTYKINKKGELIISYVERIKRGKFNDKSIIKFKVAVEGDRIILYKYLYGQGLIKIWKKTKGPYFTYFKDCVPVNK